MDAHFDQVKRARQLARGGSPRSYFAYSTILDRGALEEWRAQHGYLDFELPEGRLAEAPGVGLVFDFQSRWWGGRVAGLADAPDRHVFGRLFTIAAEDWPIIQHKEGAITGMCVERELEVVADGTKVQAIAFTTAPARRSLEGPVSARFLEALESGARNAGLPAAWLDELRAVSKPLA